MSQLTEIAWAKLNLGLRVLGRREDGYHDLISLFQTIDLCDDVRLTCSAQMSLQCDDPRVPVAQENLAWQAASLYLAEAGGSPVHIDLVKRKTPTRGKKLGFFEQVLGNMGRFNKKQGQQQQQ